MVEGGGLDAPVRGHSVSARKGSLRTGALIVIVDAVVFPSIPIHFISVTVMALFVSVGAMLQCQKCGGEDPDDAGGDCVGNDTVGAAGG